LRYLLLSQTSTRDDLACFIDYEFVAYHDGVVALKIVDEVFILT